MREANESRRKGKHLNVTKSVFKVSEKPRSLTRKLFLLFSQQILQKFAYQIRYVHKYLII